MPAGNVILSERRLVQVLHEPVGRRLARGVPAGGVRVARVRAVLGRGRLDLYPWRAESQLRRDSLKPELDDPVSSTRVDSRTTTISSRFRRL
jgi:hypothetical protein